MSTEVNALLDPPTAQDPGNRRWIALGVLCLGVVMMVLDTTIVNVALPSIREALGFSESALVWVVNAYMLTFGGFLLLAGRLGDLYGHRRVFLGGLALFTVASLACGLAPNQFVLVAARALQGIGGSAVSAISLSLLMNMFPSTVDRAKAMGVYSFVCAGGGSVGVLLGGLLVQTLDWHWIFLVNLPIGALVFALTRILVPASRADGAQGRLDWGGATLATTSLMLAVFGIVGGNEAGWTSPRTLGFLGSSAVLLAAFLLVEARIESPLMPLRLFRSWNMVVANAVGVLWAAAMFAWFFLSALYLQLVLGCSAMEVGLAFLPSNLIMGACSVGLSAHLVVRFGVRKPLAAGLGLAACGLALFARAPVGGSVLVDVLPGMLLLGLGAGIAFNPLLLAAMNGVDPHESGLASGVVNTSFMMGGALGLAVLASLAASRTASLTESVGAGAEALNGGYHAAFVVGAVFAATGAALGGFLLREPARGADAPSGVVSPH